MIGPRRNISEQWDDYKARHYLLQQNQSVIHGDYSPLFPSCHFYLRFIPITVIFRIIHILVPICTAYSFVILYYISFVLHDVTSTLTHDAGVNPKTVLFF